MHLRGKRVKDFDVSVFARATAGMTGADMMGLVNEAGIIAVRQGRNEITENDLFDVSPFLILTICIKVSKQQRYVSYLCCSHTCIDGCLAGVDVSDLCCRCYN